MRITLHRLAAQDLDDALAFYGREAGQGVARRLPLRGFPYSLIYRVDGEQLRVLVLRHQHRDPEFGAARQ